MSAQTPAAPARLPLTRIRVLQHGRSLPTTFAGKLLADLGAAVALGPGPSGFDADSAFARPSARSAEAYRRYFDERKVAAGPRRARDVLANYDVVLLDRESLADPSFAPDVLTAEFPQLVVTTVTPYGTAGPRAHWHGTDFTLQARGGLSFGVGEPDGPPLPLPGRQAELQGGLAAAIGSLIAVLGRGPLRGGQHVDVSIDDVLSILFTGYYLPRFMYGGGVPGRRAGRGGSNSPYPNTVMGCRDGLVALIAPQVEQWIRFVNLMGQPEWTRQPRYRDRRAMQWEYKDEVDELVQPWFLHRSKAELLPDFIAARIPFAPLLEGRDLLTSAHLRERSALRVLDIAGRPATAPAAPYLLDGARPGNGPAVPPPAAQLAVPDPPDRTARVRLLDDAPPGALSGFRILDLGTAWAGGMAGRILADFGAEVIKVESSGHMDGARRGRPIGVEDTQGGDEGRWPDLQPGFHVISRNKLSVGIDLQAPGAADLIAELAGSCDAVLHNFSCGVMERLGLTDEVLRRRNAALLIVGQSVAGYCGSMSGYVGYNTTVGGLSGFFSMIGYQDETPIGTAEGLYSDIVSALTTVYVTLAGLLGGHGATAEVSQWEATMALVPELLIAASTGAEVATCGRRAWGVAPDGVYPCAGEDQWLAISVPDQARWAALCRLTGHAELLDEPELATPAGRRARATYLDRLIAAWTRQHDPVTAAQLAQEQGIPADAVSTIEDLFADEHLRSREAWIDTEHPLLGFEPLPGAGLRLSRTPGAVARTAPSIGQDTDLILRRVLGLDQERIDQLVASRVVERATVEV